MISVGHSLCQTVRSARGDIRWGRMHERLRSIRPTALDHQQTRANEHQEAAEYAVLPHLGALAAQQGAKQARANGVAVHDDDVGKAQRGA